MAVAIPFVRQDSVDYGACVQLSPRIRRVTAPNPGPFTYTGTGVYIVGTERVAVIDPGPEIPGHLEALQRALHGETVTHVLVTHTHLDHSPLAHPLARWAGCEVWAAASVTPAPAAGVVMEEGEDHGFRPDRIFADGDCVSGPDWTLEAVATPGHASGHLCFALHEEKALFSGDHVMGWSTTVISPPDGDMQAYFDSLEKVRARDFATLWPTHGAPVRDLAPFLDALVAHRLDREAQILARLADGPTRIREMVPQMYAGVDSRLWPAACHSVLAHMIRLTALGRVTADGGGAGMDSLYRLA